MYRAVNSPHLFVIFGATGDLARRKLLPALFHLAREELIPPTCHLLALSRRDLGDEGYRRLATESLLEEQAGDAGQIRRWCEERVHFQTLGEGREEDYWRLALRMSELDRAVNRPPNHIFYLSLPPDAFVSSIEGLARAGLSCGDGWVRLVVEKPFGHDLESAHQLNQLVHRHFDENQVYRIDHFLGKEQVQNLFVFRFANSVFETMWNRNHIRNVQVTATEDVGVGGRADYYDQAGTLRDMVQNHLTQLLALTAMEPPATPGADALRNEKVKVLQSIEPIRPQDVIFGQYTRGRLGDEEAPGYLEELGGESSTETFAALRLRIANWRWQGVPFYLRTGKRMPFKVSQVVITFEQPPVSFFPQSARGSVTPNTLVITLQPEEGFNFYLQVKRPGQPPQLEQVDLHLYYDEVFDERIPEAYETLLLDVIEGDQTLFVRSDEVEASWRLYTPLLGAGLPVHPYTAGSWGPTEANSLMPGEETWYCPRPEELIRRH